MISDRHPQLLSGQPHAKASDCDVPLSGPGLRESSTAAMTVSVQCSAMCGLGMPKCGVRFSSLTRMETFSSVLLVFVWASVHFMPFWGRCRTLQKGKWRIPRPGRSYGLQQTLAKTWADTNWLFAKPIIQRWPDGFFLAGQDVTLQHAPLWRLSFFA